MVVEDCGGRSENLDAMAIYRTAAALPNSSRRVAVDESKFTYSQFRTQHWIWES